MLLLDLVSLFFVCLFFEVFYTLDVGLDYFCLKVYFIRYYNDYSSFFLRSGGVVSSVCLSKPSGMQAELWGGPWFADLQLLV